MEWFRHDCNAHDDLKIRKLLRNYGECAYGAYWLIVELLYQNGGSASADEIADTFSLMSSPNMEQILAESGLFQIGEDGTWSSNRVKEEIDFQEERRRKAIESGRIGGQTRAINAGQTLRNTQAPLKQPLSDPQALPSTLPNLTKQNKDNTISDNPSIKRNINNTSSSAESSKNASTSDEVPAAEEPAFITLPSNKGEEVPISEKMVQVWKDAYPAVDVKAELRKMKSWCISNPKLRKTAQGMKRFCDNWLSKAQDRVGRVPQQETIRGTNIQMSLVADGTRGRLEPEVKFD